MRVRSLPFLPVVVVLVVGCEQPSEPEAGAPAARPVPEGPALAAKTYATYLLPRTVVRAGAGPQRDTIPLDDLPLERFMAPFRLVVQEHAGADVLGSISLDGVVVLRLGNVAPGAQATRAIEVEAGSELELELRGAQGGAITLRVEGLIQPAPVIRFTSLPRGSMLKRGDLDSLEMHVRGSACHGTYPIVELTVNGVPMTVSGDSLCEPFAAVVTSPWGMSAVDVYARNSAGRETHRRQSFLRSRSYTAPALTLPGDLTEDTTVDVRWASALRFSETGFDKLTSPIPAAIHDAAFGSGISTAGNEYHVGCATWEFQHDSAHSHLDLVNRTITSASTLQVTMQLDLTVYFQARYSSAGLGCAPGSSTGTATLTLSNLLVDGDLEFGVDPAGGGLEISAGVDHISASAETFSTQGFNAGAAVHLESLHESIDDFMQNELGAEATRLLEVAADVGLPFQRASLPSARLSALGLDFQQAAGAFRLRNDFTEVGLRTRVAPMVPRAGEPPQRGSMRSGVSPGVAVPPQDASIYVSDDFVNQVLWAAWQAGHFDDDELAIADGLTAEVYSMLPPVLMPGDAPRVLIGWGDVRLSALVDPADFGLGDPPSGAVPVTAYARLYVDTRLRVDSLDKALEPRGSVVHADVEIVSPPGTLLDEAALADAMAAALEAWALPRLRPVIEAVPLLEVDMSGFFGAEPGTMLDLDAFVDARAGRFHRAGGQFGAF